MARWELALGMAVVAVGTWLRTVHLATPSLWWDELVHIRTAALPDVWAVIRTAWFGIAPEGGNAGAVPLDYVLLHAWMRLVPHPGPAWLEPYYRAPACLAAIAAPAAVWLGMRRLAGPVAALIGGAALAGSVFHACYAAEARFYSLFIVMTILQVTAFARLVRDMHARRWWTFILTTVALVMTGLYGGFVVVVEYGVLVVVAARVWRQSGDRRVAAWVAATGGLLGLAGTAYLVGAGAGVKYARMLVRYPGPWGQIPASFTMFASFAPGLGWVLVLASPVALVWAGLRRRALVPLLVVCAGSLLAIPAIVHIAYWKLYYFHPRHAVFLVPLAAIGVGIAVGAACEAVCRRQAWAALVGVALVLGAQAPTMRKFATNPGAFFGVSKTDRDYHRLAATLVERVQALRPHERLLVLVEKNKAGYLGNPVLGFYLKEWGIARRVVLRGYADPVATLNHVRTVCPAGCVGLLGPDYDEKLGVGDPYAQGVFFRGFLGLGGQGLGWPAWVRGTTVVMYADHGKTPQLGFRRTPYRGFALFEPSG